VLQDGVFRTVRVCLRTAARRQHPERECGIPTRWNARSRGTVPVPHERTPRGPERPSLEARALHRVLPSIRRAVQPSESLRPAAAGLPMLPRFYRQRNPIDADRPRRQSAPSSTRLETPPEPRNGPSRRRPLRAAGRVIPRLVDADPKRFPFDNFKPFSPAFRPAFHLSLTLLVRYRSR